MGHGLGGRTRVAWLRVVHLGRVQGASKTQDLEVGLRMICGGGWTMAQVAAMRPVVIVNGEFTREQ